MQERRNSIANAQELLLSCIKPSIWKGMVCEYNMTNHNPVLCACDKLFFFLFSNTIVLEAHLYLP